MQSTLWAPTVYKYIRVVGCVPNKECCSTGIRELSIQFCNGRRESHHPFSNSSSNTFGRDCASESEAYCFFFLSSGKSGWVFIYIYMYVCNTVLQIVEAHPLIHPSFNGRCAQLSYPGVFMYGSSYRSKRHLYIYMFLFILFDAHAVVVYPPPLGPVIY